MGDVLVCVMCENGGNASAVFHQTMEVIERFGWAVIGLENAAYLSYTVGLTFQRVPELAVRGLQPRDAKEVLNEVAGRLVSDRGLHPGSTMTIKDGRTVRLTKLWHLKELVMVRKFFGDNKPVAPTALELIVV